MICIRSVISLVEITIIDSNNHACVQKRCIAIRADREGEGAGKLLMTLSNPIMEEKSDNKIYAKSLFASTRDIS